MYLVIIMKKMLLIEDDISLNKGICATLLANGIEIESAFSMEEGAEKFEKNTYDLIILDLNLPDGNGLDFLKEIRKSSEIPVIILTAKDLEIDEVLGFEMGANDYITKPFSLAILRARVNAQLNHYDDKSQYKKDLFSFDFSKMKFFVDGIEIELSKTEQKLLKYLIDNKGITLTREKILDHIWTEVGDYVYENTVSVTIKRLRDKLEENPKHPKYIKTVYGIGYYWED